MDNSTISLQELLDCISRLRDDVNALTVAFSHLALSIPREQMLPTLASFILNHATPNGPRNNKILSSGWRHCWKKIMLAKLPFRRSLQGTSNPSR